MDMTELKNITDANKLSPLMPVFFIGHGNPMNAIEDNPFTRSLAEIGNSLTEKPKAVMVISAHWLTNGSFVNVLPKPELIYDFGGFPEELYTVKYPAPGSPEYAKQVTDIASVIKADTNWGLDHGAWSILKHIFPKADIPVFQMSIDYSASMQRHFELGLMLKMLRSKGVIIIGSGNIVHNLRLWFSRGGNMPYDWAIEFDEWVKEKIDNRDFESLINYEKQGSAAKLAVPTTEHYIPMLYTLGLADTKEQITYTYEEVFTSASMRCFRVG